MRCAAEGSLRSTVVLRWACRVVRSGTRAAVAVRDIAAGDLALGAAALGGLQRSASSSEEGPGPGERPGPGEAPADPGGRPVDRRAGLAQHRPVTEDPSPRYGARTPTLVMTVRGVGGAA